MLFQLTFLSQDHTTSVWNITVHWTSHYDLAEKICKEFCIHRFRKKSWNQITKKVTSMIWQNFFLCLLFSEKSMSPKPLDWSEGQTHGWILPIFVVYYNQINLILCRRSCFHRVWLLLSSNHRRKVCRLISQIKLVKIVDNWGHSRWKGLKLQQIELKLI